MYVLCLRQFLEKPVGKIVVRAGCLNFHTVRIYFFRNFSFFIAGARCSGGGGLAQKRWSPGGCCRVGGRVGGVDGYGVDSSH